MSGNRHLHLSAEWGALGQAMLRERQRGGGTDSSVLQELTHWLRQALGHAHAQKHQVTPGEAAILNCSEDLASPFSNTPLGPRMLYVEALSRREALY